MRPSAPPSPLTPDRLPSTVPRVENKLKGNPGVDEKNLRSDPIKFASLIAHQLQSPLSAIGTALQSVLAEYSGPLQPRQRGVLEKANARVEQAVTTIRRMLAIVRAEENAEHVTRAASLVEAMREAHAQHFSEASRREISLSLDPPGEDIHVQIAEAALAEILSAVVSNALKYTPHHGEIHMLARVDTPPGMVSISVADSGIGVPDDAREKIFEPFFRTASAQETTQPGVGLGLTFVRSIVKASSGSVTVGKSSLGGAEFIIALPRAAAPVVGVAGSRAPTGLKVVIIGGVTAGPKAAAKIFRLQPDADITIIERGSVMSYAGCGLPYYVSGVIRDQRHLTSTPAGVDRDPVFFRNTMNVHVMNRTEAMEIDRGGHRVRVRDGLSGRESWRPYDKLLLATGASPLLLEGLDTGLKNVFTLHGVRDAEGIKTAMEEGHAEDVVIIGGGLIGIEMTEALVRKGARVTVIERLPHILPIVDAEIAVLVEKHLRANGVRVVTGARALSLGGKGAVSHVATDQGVFGASRVILALGIRPNVELAVQAGLELGSLGGVQINDRMQTSDPDIYAAGDCVENVHRVTGKPCYIPLGSTATKHGRVAAINMCGGEERFPGVIGSSLCKVFDYSVGRTGLGEADALQAGFEAVSVLAPGPDRDHFMPTAGRILLKLIVDAKTRRLLGAQATGPGALDKRIDVAAMAITAGLTLDALASSDLCYAPSIGTAMDNIITAANVARNKLDGRFQGVLPAALYARLAGREDMLLLDVRTPQEFEEGHLPRAELMPLGALRGRLAEISRARAIVVYCDISLRAYEAALILAAAGFTNVRVLEGGLAMWPYDVIGG